MNKCIIGLMVTDRMKAAETVQSTLTTYGCSIGTRLGLHGVEEGSCSNDGILLLELVGNSSTWGPLEDELRNIDGVEIQIMQFG